MKLRPYAYANMFLAIAAAAMLVMACSALRPGATPSATPPDDNGSTTESPAPTISFGRGGADPGDQSPLFTDAPDPTYFKTPNRTPNSSPWTIPDCLNR